MFVCGRDERRVGQLAAAWGEFGYGFRHYYTDGIHQPGKTSVIEEGRKIAAREPQPDLAALQALAAYACMGTPDHIRKVLLEYEAAGVDQVIFMHQMGKLSHEDICGGLELFGKEVLPEFLERDDQASREKARRLEPVIEKAMKGRIVPPSPPYDEHYAFRADGTQIKHFGHEPEAGGGRQAKLSGEWTNRLSRRRMRAQTDDEAPGIARQRQGWLMVLVLFVIMAIIVGCIDSTGVLFTPLLKHFGWSRTRMSTVISAMSLAIGLSTPVAGWFVDRIGARVVIAVGAAIAGAGMLIASQANSFLALSRGLCAVRGRLRRRLAGFRLLRGRELVWRQTWYGDGRDDDGDLDRRGAVGAAGQPCGGSRRMALGAGNAGQRFDADRAAVGDLFPAHAGRRPPGADGRSRRPRTPPGG